MNLRIKRSKTTIFVECRLSDSVFKLKTAISNMIYKDKLAKDIRLLVSGKTG
jgi:hypothetical protein